MCPVGLEAEAGWVTVRGTSSIASVGAGLPSEAQSVPLPLWALGTLGG